jgi:thiol-disulfide isomerase/thioredoxin
MLNGKYFEIPLWTWLIIIVVILYSVYHISRSKQYEQKKEKINLISNTKEELLNSKHSNIVIYNFNTTWCGWSKRFQPEWNEFSKYIINLKNNIKALDIKCDDGESENILLASKYNVPGYPYIVIVIDGKEPIVYDGERTSTALIEYLQNGVLRGDIGDML